MNFLKNKKVAITIALAIIILSSLYSISKRPTENSANVPQTGNTPGSEQRETATPAVSETPVPVDEAYDLGKRFYEAGEYSRAITELQKVRDSSFYYADAQLLLIEASNGYRTEILQTAGSYAERQEYMTAVDIIKNALLTLPDDSELRRVSDEYTANYRALVRSEAIENARVSAESEDYAAAVQAIQAAISELGNEAELTSLYSDYVEKYRTALISQADLVLRQDGYEAAIDVIKDGLNVLPADSIFEAAIEEYKTYVPVYLYEDIDYLRCSDNIYIQNESITDNKGVEYSGHRTFHNNHLSYSASILFDLDQKYSTFSGTVLLPYKHRGTSFSAYISVYGDDILLYQSDAITMGFKTDTFTIDITGVSTLTISFKNSTGLSFDSDWVVGYLTNAYLTK